MRTLEGHKVNPTNDQLVITVMDQPGSGGACHHYQITGLDTETNPSDPFFARYGGSAQQLTILFQNGPTKEAGVNGVTHEALLAILIDRLECFQAGPYACFANEHALQHLRDAQTTLLNRTRERMARGVEGTHQK